MFAQEGSRRPRRLVDYASLREYLHGLVEEVERAARRILNEHGAELADSFWEYLETSSV